MISGVVFFHEKAGIQLMACGAWCPLMKEYILDQISVCYHPAVEKSKVKAGRERKVKRSRCGVGVAILCLLGFDSHNRERMQPSHAFL